MQTNARAYNRAIASGNLELVRAMDAELDRQWADLHPASVANSERFAASQYEAQQRAACPDEGSSDHVSWGEKYSDWAYGAEQVNVKLIGIAVEGTAQGVICASFNAG